MPTNVELKQEQIDKIKAAHQQVMEKLNKALIEGMEPKLVLCYVRGAIFDQITMMHQINLAAGLAH